MPVADAMAREGTRSGWSLNTIVYPGGTDVKFNAVTVDGLSNMGFHLQRDAGFYDRWRKVHPDMELGTPSSNMTSCAIRATSISLRCRIPSHRISSRWLATCKDGCSAFPRWGGGTPIFFVAGNCGVIAGDLFAGVDWFYSRHSSWILH